MGELPRPQLRIVVAGPGAARARLEARIVEGGSLVLVAPRRGSLRQQLEATAGDVVVVEARREALDRALRLLARRTRPIPAVVLTDAPRRAWSPAAWRAGVRSVLPVEATSAEILAAVHAAAAGLVALHPDAVVPRTRAIAVPPHQVRSDPALTPRETEVLEMMAEGLANKTVAARLGISDQTVKFHVASIFVKLGVTSRTEAVTTGLRRGLIMV